MDHDKDKVDEVLLALMWLVMHEDGPVTRAWKGFDWDALDRLHEKGLISNPKNRAKSVVLSDEAVELSEKLFQKHFGRIGLPEPPLSLPFVGQAFQPAGSKVPFMAGWKACPTSKSFEIPYLAGPGRGRRQMMSESPQQHDHPWQDPIVMGVRAARQELLAKVGYDLHALCELLRSHQAAEGRRPVQRTPRPVQSLKYGVRETEADEPLSTL